MTTPPKILLVVLDNLGDTVMATAALRPLRRLLPGARIGMFVKKYAAGVLVDHSVIDRIHAADPFWDSSPGRPPGGLGAFLGVVNDIRRERYDAALILNTEWRRAAAMAAARIPRRMGYVRRHAGVFLTDGIAAPANPGHFVDDHRRLVELLAPAAAGEAFSPRLELTPAEAAWAAEWRRAAGWSESRDTTVIHPFSGDDRKNWPVDRWIDLADRLHRRFGGTCAVVCSAGERDRLAAWPRQNHLRIVAGTPLAHVKAIVARARLMIGGDSGIGHVAAALGVPVLSLFGPGDPTRSAPIGAGISVLKRDPLSTLSVDEVESAAAELLGRAAPVEEGA